MYMNASDLDLIECFTKHLNNYVYSKYGDSSWIDLPEIVINLCGTRNVFPTDLKKCVHSINMNITDEQHTILFSKFNTDTNFSFFIYKNQETISINEIKQIIKNELSEEQFKFLLFIFNKLNLLFDNNMCSNNLVYSRFYNIDLLDTDEYVRKPITFHNFKKYNVAILKNSKMFNDNIPFEDFVKIIENEWNPMYINLGNQIINYKHTNKNNIDQINQLITINKNSNDTNVLLEKNITDLETKIKYINKKQSLLLQEKQSIELNLVDVEKQFNNELQKNKQLNCCIDDLKKQYEYEVKINEQMNCDINELKEQYETDVQSKKMLEDEILECKQLYETEMQANKKLMQKNQEFKTEIENVCTIYFQN